MPGDDDDIIIHHAQNKVTVKPGDQLYAQIVALFDQEQPQQVSHTEPNTGEQT